MGKQKKMIAEAGFTLVELSIVIVIIGFLVAGIAAGANLVKQAQLRSVISDFQQFQTGYNGFVGRFNAVPGDFASAFQYWNGTQCGQTATSTLCNGDGDGVIEPGIDSTTDETAKSWKQMQLAGFIGAGIVVVPTTLVAITPGLNAPNSKLTGSGYIMAGTTNLTRTGTASNIGFGAGSTNYVYIGKASTTPLNLVDGALTAEQAYSIDAKLDDGVPATSTTFTGFNTGTVRVVKGSANAANTCLDNDTTPTTYQISNPTSACLLGLALN
jgi:prepilin-type N-terminal cleavage/methylation domain-containing protein